jgi:CRISPR-associated protein Cas1
MNAFTPTEMKTILHSKRANLYYLEHCRVLVKGGRVEFVTDEGRRALYWNIPIANTTTLLLGTGTSLTQAAMRELAKAGVLVGFSGGGGTPLFSATERDTDIVWFTPQSEYRPTEYLQAWVQFWFDDTLRLEAAKIFQTARINRIRKHWVAIRVQADNGLSVESQYLEPLLDASYDRVTQAEDITHLLTEEARLTKELYKLAA